VTASDDPARCARTGSLHVDDIWACVVRPKCQMAMLRYDAERFGFR
jgi:hypothetical protein